MTTRKTIVLVITFFIAFLANSLHAQVATDTLSASQYFKTGDSLLTGRKLDSSIVYFKKALPIYEKANAWERVVRCYNKISENQWRIDKFEKSLTNANKALKLSSKHLKTNKREEAYAYNNIGSAFLMQQKYDKAIDYYKKSLTLRKNILGKNHLETITSYFNIGLTYDRMEKYNIALSYMEKALFLGKKNLNGNHLEIARYNHGIARLYQQIGEHDKALFFYNARLSVLLDHYGKNDSSIANIFNKIGISYKNKGEFDKALHYYKQAIDIENRINKKISSPFIYNNIGVVYKHKGQYDKALIYYKKSLNENISIRGVNNRIVANLFNNIGNIYRLKRNNDLALKYYIRALNIRAKISGKNNSEIADSYNDIGELYYQKRNYDNALDYYNKSLKIRNYIFGKFHPYIANSYINIGNIDLMRKDYTNALKNYHRSLDIQLTIFEKYHPNVALSYNDIAKVNIAQKQYQNALTNYYKAIVSNTKQDYSKNDIADLDQYYNLTILLATLQGQTKTYIKLYKQNQTLNDLKNAISICQKADTLINTIRQSFTNYQDKVTFAKQAKEVYQGAIEAQLLFYTTEKDQKALEKAFYYAERSKANTLKELLNDANAKTFTGLPSNLVTLEKDLRINKAFYQSKITEEQSEQGIDTTKITRYENKLFEISRRQDSLTQILEKNYPKYYQLKHKNDIVSVSKLQQQLNVGTTVVEFFTSDSITYAFTIAKNEIAVQELATADLTKKVETFRDAITSKHVGDFKTSSYKLYQQLIAPIADQLVGDELIIIPDGPLWHLNVELLLTQNKDSNNPKDLPYLLNNYAISYANSANVLFTTNENTQKSKKQEECLAFSFTDSTNVVDAKTMSLATLRDAGDDLPGTRKEIKAISEIIDGQYYFGSEAIEANFKKNAGQYNILHLALHGEVDNERPENSRLYFTKSKDTIEDNLLYSHELFALDIPAELTVLSACNTGSGKIAKGEGIMSLGTAFQYAGTKSLLLTSWEVSDQTTPELMKHFYTNLKAGMNKAKALQQAKLQYLKTADINRTHPFYWGGFYLVGDAAPISFSDHNWLYWVLGLVLFGILFLVMFWYRKRVN